MQTCKICRGSLGDIIKAKEMMFGTRDQFDYAQCTNCKTIQILEFPDAIEKYYPTNYYSFSNRVVPLHKQHWLKRLFANAIIKHLYKKNIHPILNFLKPIQVLPSQKILDIGCGNGVLVCIMFNLGFSKIGGVDKYIHETYDYGHGVKILKKDLSELESNSYNLLIMHHVFEHIPNPVEELSKCYQLLKKGGYLLVAIPVVGEAWKLYQENWVQLDAPRHFFIHSADSIQLLAQQTGFVIENVLYNSSAFQFWGSELYKQNIPLYKNGSPKMADPAIFFMPEQIQNWENDSRKLNKQHQGDQAIFYLRKD